MMGLKRKLLLSLFIPLTILVAVPFSLLAPSVASAAQVDGKNSATRVALYSYYKDMSACMASAIGSQDGLGLATHDDEIKSSKLVSGTTLAQDGEIYGYYLTAGNTSLKDIAPDGLTNCTADDSALFVKGLKLFGLNPIDVVCTMGYTRTNGGACRDQSSTEWFNIGAPSNMLDKFKTQLRIAGWGVDKEPTLSNADNYELYSKSLIIACTTGNVITNTQGAAADSLYVLKTGANSSVTYSASGDHKFSWPDVYIMQGDYANKTGVEKVTCKQALDKANSFVVDAVATQACETKYSSNPTYITACENGYSKSNTGNTLYCITAYPAPFSGTADHGTRADTPDSLALRAACFSGEGVVGGQQCFSDLKYTEGLLHQACTLGAQYPGSAEFCTTSANAKLWSTSSDKVALLQACKDGQALNLTPDSLNVQTSLTPVDGKEASTTCAIPSIGWIVCPIVSSIAQMTDGIYSVISGMLVTDVQTLVVGGGTYNAWSAIRGFANVGFVIIFLIIIFSQLSSVGITNYGVKKLLPRLIVVAILVNVSFFLCQLLVDVSNILGGTIPNIFSNIPVFGPADSFDDSGNPFTDLAVKILAGTFATSAGVAAVGVSAVIVMFTGVGLFVPLALAALLAVLVTIFILIARNVLIILLVAIAPLAFLAMLLPNTENLFKQWRKMFVGMLLVYPMVALLFGASQLASNIILSSGASTYQQLFGMAALFIPLFITPILLKNSLNAIPAIGSLATKLQARTNGLVGKTAKTFYKSTPIARGIANRKAGRENYRDQKYAEDLEKGGLTGLMARGIPGVNKWTAAGRYADRALSRSALGATEKADSEDVKAEKASMMIKRLTLKQLEAELVDATIRGDSVKARAAQSILMTSGEPGKMAHDRALKELDTRFASLDAAVKAGTANEEQKRQHTSIPSGYDALRRNLKFNHGDVKSTDAIADKFMNADSGTSYSAAVTQMTSGGGLAGLTPMQFASQPIDYIISSGIKKKQAQEILANAAVSAIMSPEKKAYLASIK